MNASHSLNAGTFVVTGAGTGIGAATARLLAGRGAGTLILAGRRVGVLGAIAAEIRSAAPACDVVDVQGDVTDAACRMQIALEVKSRGARLNGLINNAGYFAGAALAQTTDAEWQRNMAVNLTAPFQLTRELLAYLAAAPGASVVNVSSTLAVKPIPNTAAYNAAKAGLVQLTRTLAVELGPAGIRVNAVLPAIIETPMYADRYSDEESYRQGLLDAAKLHPLGRIGQPHDVAEAIGFLVSPASAWITGIALPVDGGMLCT